MPNLQEAVFGPGVAQVLPHLEEVCKDLGRYQYPFVAEDDFDKICSSAEVVTGEEARHAKAAEIMCIYAREVVYRAHYTALTCLRKTHRWVHGMLSAATEPNILTFVATFRGLLECSADAADVLKLVPVTLAENHERFVTAVRSQASEMWGCPDLENALIHYSHGTRKPDTTRPPSHKAKTMREYLDGLANDGVPLVHDCYSELCDMTHPGALGVAWFFAEENDVMTFADDRDAEEIAYLSQKYQAMFSPMLCFCIDALLTLRVINAFDVPGLKVEAVNRWDFGANKNWSKMRSVMPSLDPAPMRVRAAVPDRLPGLFAPVVGKAAIKVGRNDPCPCNSGKKFKNCCMRRDGGG
jgi:hypothetical protein